MIARLAVRFERASLFFLKANEYFVGERLGDGKPLNTRMDGLRNDHPGLRRIFQLIQPMIYFFDAGVKRREID